MNGEMNVFNSLNLDLSRVTYHIKPRRSGTCVAGRLIPALAYEVMPGSTVSVNLASLFKMSTPVYPTMDNLFADVFFFFVPNKLVLGRRYGTPNLNDSNQDWKAIIGAQSNLVNMPLPASGTTLPYLVLGNRSPYLLCDYFNVGGTWSGGVTFHANCLPFLSYFAIWNENFRDENTMDPVTWSFYGDQVTLNGFVPLWINNLEDVGTNIPSGSNYGVVNALKCDSVLPATGAGASNLMPFPTCRFHSYLGSALPWPQRNSAGVELPLGNSAPVITGTDLLKSDGTSDYLKSVGMQVAGLNGTLFSRLPNNSLLQANGTNSAVYGSGTQTDYAVATAGVVPTNLYADLSEATAANVNALRAAIQQQRWYEKLARSGNRYDELKYGLFGVRGLDAVLDKPLYLGGKRIPLSIEMVASTQGGTSASSGQGAGSLGALGAFSHTNDLDHYFSHSFDDWGTLMMVFTIRHHTTVDGFTKKMWLRRTREDFYFPTFAHLGEMSITGTEISGNPTASNVYGYQQAWEDSRFEPDLVTGLLKDGRSLDYMTYVEAFSSHSTIAGYLNASKQIASIDKTLAVKSFSSGFQFVYQFDFDIKARLPLPYDSVPGLMDHF